MKEVWKTIENWPNYDVSNLGRILSRKRNKIANLRTDRNGYLMVSLSHEGRFKEIGVHRLVASAFVEGYFEGAHVKFKDGNRANCKTTNLEWQEPHNKSIINGFGVRVASGREERTVSIQNPDTGEYEYIHPLYIQPFKDKGLIDEDWTPPKRRY